MNTIIYCTDISGAVKLCKHISLDKLKELNELALLMDAPLKIIPFNIYCNVCFKIFEIKLGVHK